MRHTDADYQSAYDRYVEAKLKYKRNNAPQYEGNSKMGQSLILPDDIVDVVDGRDLLDTFVSENMIRIKEQADDRARKAWVENKNKEIRGEYFKQAEVAHKKLWSACGESSVGHSLRTIDVHGYSISVCEVCKYHTGTQGSSGSQSKAFRMNNEMVLATARRMIEVDREKGLLVWPTIDDYQAPLPKKKWFR